LLDVALSISRDFGQPVLGIVAPPKFLVEAKPVPAVPKVAITEDDHPRRTEDQIRFPR
jgi:hypothetical protein